MVRAKAPPRHPLHYYHGPPATHTRHHELGRLRSCIMDRPTESITVSKSYMQFIMKPIQAYN